MPGGSHFGSRPEGLPSGYQPAPQPTPEEEEAASVRAFCLFAGEASEEDFNEDEFEDELRLEQEWLEAEHLEG